MKWFQIDTSDLREMPFESHELDRFAVRVGDVLICEGGEAGRAAIWEEARTDVKFQKAIHRVRPGNELFNRYFVHRLLADYRSGKLADYYTGTTIKHLTGQDLATYEFPLPPIPEQRRIAAVLDQAEVLRAKRQAALAKLDTLTQAIFVDMFGEPSKNPKGWPCTNIGELAEQVTDGEHLTPKRTNSGIKLLSARNIRDGYIDFGHVDYVSVEEHDRIKRRCNPSLGDVLISCSGTIGRVAAVKTSESFSLVRSVALVRPRCDLVGTTFLENYLRTPSLKTKMLQRANASSQANLFQGQIRELPVFLPPLQLQSDFSRRVAAVEKLKISHHTSLAKFDALFASLQNRAFRGDL